MAVSFREGNWPQKNWREIHCWWKKSCTSWYCKYPIIYDGFHTSQVVIAGFLNHQPYSAPQQLGWPSGSYSFDASQPVTSDQMLDWKVKGRTRKSFEISRLPWRVSHGNVKVVSKKSACSLLWGFIRIHIKINIACVLKIVVSFTSMLQQNCELPWLQILSWLSLGNPKQLLVHFAICTPPEDMIQMQPASLGIRMQISLKPVTGCLLGHFPRKIDRSDINVQSFQLQNQIKNGRNTQKWTFASGNRQILCILTNLILTWSR